MKEVKLEVQETKELAPIIESLKKMDVGIKSEEYFIEKARYLKSLIKPEQKGLKILTDNRDTCENCGEWEDLYRLEDWDDCDALCQECFCEWLIENKKRVC